MIGQKLLAPVTADITVPLPPQEAYDLFTAGLDRWWIRTHNIGATPMRQAVLEGKAGGRWYEVDEDGTECEWGRVLVWDPPGRLVLIWQIAADWTYDPTLETELEVTFTDNGDGSTTVAVEHRDMDRYGEKAEQMRTVLSSPNGWSGLLARYATAAV